MIFARHLWPMLAVLFIASDAKANGFAMGHRHVPIVVDVDATLYTGETVRLRAGQPIYLDDRFRTYYREIPVELPSGALPASLDGYRLYRQRFLNRSAALLSLEASEEANPIARTWLYLLAGHSYVIAGGFTDKRANEAYQRSSEPPLNVYSPYGLFFNAKLLAVNRDYRGAKRVLQRILERFGEGAIDAVRSTKRVILFTTYTHGSAITEGYFSGFRGLNWTIQVLDRLLEAQQKYQMADQGDEAEVRPQVYFDYATAVEDLWKFFPPKEFFGFKKPDEPREVLRRIVTEYPASDVAPLAYFRLLTYYEAPYEFNGDDIARYRFEFRQMTKFLSKYPDSKLSDDARKRLAEAEKFLKDSGNPPR